MNKSSYYPDRNIIIRGVTSAGKKQNTKISHVNDQADDDKLYELSRKIYALSSNSYRSAVKQDNTTLLIMEKLKPQLWYNGEYYVRNVNVNFADIKSGTMSDGYYLLPKPLVFFIDQVKSDRRSEELSYNEALSIELVITNETKLLIKLTEYDKEYDRKRDILYRYFNISLAGSGEPITGTISITTTETTSFAPATPFTITIKE